MGFLSPALLGGVALAAIPIVLHLVMRRQPQRHVFPALRFVQQRRDANRRRLQLRHLLLLALRCLLIAGLALALARPTLQGSGLRGKQGAPLAVAVVIDNAPRMAYVVNGSTRLESAAGIAAQWIGKLPEASAAAVVDRGRATSGFAVDLATAQSRLRNVRIATNPRSMSETLSEAVELVAARTDHRQEVFVFSDLAAQAWPIDELARSAAALEEAPEVKVYVVDMGSDDAQNSWLGPVELNSATPRVGEPLRAATDVFSSAPEESLLVELYLEASDGSLEKRDEQIALATPASAGKSVARVAFEIADLPRGTHQGVLRLTAADPLTQDNERYFTVDVRPPARILLLAPRAADALFVREALAPSALEDRSPRYLCDVRTLEDQPRWDDYDAIWLLDPWPLAESWWQGLLDFAQAGGGVGIFLGHRIDDVAAFNAEAPQRLLPGALWRRSRDETYFRPRRYDHPALTGMRDYAEGIPWSLYRVFQFWEFRGELYDDAYVIAPFANDQPALIERPAGRGRILTMTTPLSDRLNPEGREPWNLLPTHSDPWPFVALCDQLASYLSKQSQERLNYLAGETARVSLGGREAIANYKLRQPDGEPIRGAAVGSDDAVAISSTSATGNYRLTAGGRSQRVDRGFSVNLAASESDLTRVDAATLLAALPKGRVQVAADLEAAEEYVDVGRSGRELFGWALAFVALVWGGEHLLANRFYREAP